MGLTTLGTSKDYSLKIPSPIVKYLLCIIEYRLELLALDSTKKTRAPCTAAVPSSTSSQLHDISVRHTASLPISLSY